MTVIRFDVRDLALGGDIPAAKGSVSVVYRDGRGVIPAYDVDGVKVIFGGEIKVPFEDGELAAPLDVPPTIAGELYARVTVENTTNGRRLVSRNVAIPATGPIDFGDLVIVDPQTFAPVVLTPSLQQTIETVAREALWDTF